MLPRPRDDDRRVRRSDRGGGRGLPDAGRSTSPCRPRLRAVARRTARTHAMYRALRAYPGAPPRIPHGLTPRSSSDASCQDLPRARRLRGALHRLRAGDAAPGVPRGCLQCHAADDAIVGIGRPAAARSRSACSATCRTGRRRASSPTTGATARGRAPGSARCPGAPAIPHDLQMRGNCGACHVGAGRRRGDPHHAPGARELPAVPRADRTGGRRCVLATARPRRRAMIVRRSGALLWHRRLHLRGRVRPDRNRISMTATRCLRRHRRTAAR
jgi:hypothetical protein